MEVYKSHDTGLELRLHDDFNQHRNHGTYLVSWKYSKFQ